jgi:exosortase
VLMLAIAAALLGCYAPVLSGMVDQWSGDQDMSHGFAVPFVLAWIIWRERSRWLALPMRGSWWGLAVVAVAGFLHFLGVLGTGLFVGAVAFLVSLAGVVLCFGGLPLLRAWAFPFLLALFMLPKLAVAYNQLTLPLQLLASKLAAWMLTSAGFGVVREGNILDVGGHRIAVAEACNGIRYLLTLGFGAAVLAYLADQKAWMRLALAACAVPVAVLANGLRVAAAGAVPAFAVGTPHEIAGIAIFMLSLGTILVLHRMINGAYRLYYA